MRPDATLFGRYSVRIATSGFVMISDVIIPQQHIRREPMDSEGSTVVCPIMFKRP